MNLVMVVILLMCVIMIIVGVFGVNCCWRLNVRFGVVILMVWVMI